MNGYRQPSGAHFSHDSIELASRAARVLLDVIGARRLRALDLCAGCGVVGLEALRELERRAPGTLSLTSPRQKVEFDFIEVQSIHARYFEANRVLVESLKVETRWREANYSELLNEPGGIYDFIVANPPYFDRDQGRLPPSELKARSRFFVDSDFETLCRVLVHALKPQGVALFLVRDLRDHMSFGNNEKPDRREQMMDQIFNRSGRWLELEPIRGTKLIRFVKGPSS